ncbi:hypothetical protein C8R42DRAFT_723267 [Lentinula raphanica]|nr:hypothetical protein C8R42DRAFT_723267 [Lentinula raphanica]
MATRTFITEDIEEDIRYTPYSFHVLTPNSCNITRITPAQLQDTTANTALHFPERGRPLGRAPHNRSLSPLPHRSTQPQRSAPPHLERSLQHQYYTPESVGIPIQHNPGQDNFAVEMELADTPPRRPASTLPTQGQMLLAELAANAGHHPPQQQDIPTHQPSSGSMHGRDVPSQTGTPPQQALNRSTSQPYQTPPTPEEFHEYLREIEQENNRRSNIILDDPPLGRHRPLGHPLAESTPFVHDDAAGRTTQFRSYSDGYWEIMGESPLHSRNLHVPDTPVRRMARRHSEDHSSHSKSSLASNHASTQCLLHHYANLARTLLINVGIENQGTLTAVGWLRLFRQIMNTPEECLSDNIRQALRMPQVTQRTNYLSTIIAQPDYISYINDTDTWSSYLRVDHLPFERMETFIPDYPNRIEYLESSPQDEQEVIAHEVGLLKIVNPARFRVDNRTYAGLLRLLRRIVQLTDDEVTPDLVRSLQQGDSADKLLDLEEQTHKPEFDALINNPDVRSVYSSAPSSHQSLNDYDEQHHIHNSQYSEMLPWEESIDITQSWQTLRDEPRSRMRQDTPSGKILSSLESPEIPPNS